MGELLAKFGAKVLGVCISKYGSCFVPGTQIVVGYDSPDPLEIEGDQASSIATSRKTLTKAIESIALGSRVIASAPEDLPRDDTFGEPDPRSWRQINLTQRRADGTELAMELLRPEWWIDSLGVRTGSVIDFDMPELNSIGQARVNSISDCPAIETGEGRVVIGRFVSRQVSNLLKVTLQDGLSFTGTSTHLVWSVDERDWQRIDELQPGERLETLSGTVAVESIEDAEA